MDLHDVIANELINNQSIAALIWLINQGREMEFQVNTIMCFISRDKAAQKVSLWAAGREQSFESIEELIENAKINQRPFMELWNEVTIKTLF